MVNQLPTANSRNATRLQNQNTSSNQPSSSDSAIQQADSESPVDLKALLERESSYIAEHNSRVQAMRVAATFSSISRLDTITEHVSDSISHKMKMLDRTLLGLQLFTALEQIAYGMQGYASESDTPYPWISDTMHKTLLASSIGAVIIALTFGNKIRKSSETEVDDLAHSFKACKDWMQHEQESIIALTKLNYEGVSFEFWDANQLLSVIEGQTNSAATSSPKRSRNRKRPPIHRDVKKFFSLPEKPLAILLKKYCGIDTSQGSITKMSASNKRKALNYFRLQLALDAQTLMTSPEALAVTQKLLADHANDMPAEVRSALESLGSVNIHTSLVEQMKEAKAPPSPPAFKKLRTKKKRPDQNGKALTAQQGRKPSDTPQAASDEPAVVNASSTYVTDHNTSNASPAQNKGDTQNNARAQSPDVLGKAQPNKSTNNRNTVSTPAIADQVAPTRPKTPKIKTRGPANRDEGHFARLIKRDTPSAPEPKITQTELNDGSVVLSFDPAKSFATPSQGVITVREIKISGKGFRQKAALKERFAKALRQTTRVMSEGSSIGKNGLVMIRPRGSDKLYFKMKILGAFGDVRLWSSQPFNQITDGILHLDTLGDHERFKRFRLSL